MSHTANKIDFPTEVCRLLKEEGPLWDCGINLPSSPSVTIPNGSRVLPMNGILACLAFFCPANEKEETYTEDNQDKSNRSSQLDVALCVFLLKSLALPNLPAAIPLELQYDDSRWMYTMLLTKESTHSFYRVFSPNFGVDVYSDDYGSDPRVLYQILHPTRTTHIDVEDYDGSHRDIQCRYGYMLPPEQVPNADDDSVDLAGVAEEWWIDLACSNWHDILALEVQLLDQIRDKALSELEPHRHLFSASYCSEDAFLFNKLLTSVYPRFDCSTIPLRSLVSASYGHPDQLVATRSHQSEESWRRQLDTASSAPSEGMVGDACRSGNLPMAKKLHEFGVLVALEAWTTQLVQERFPKVKSWIEEVNSLSQLI